nr:retrotransposon protein, putative, Ty1-copia subclass [Tanacetum cinerariifolium]
MTGAKFDIEKFDGTGDFGLWRVKMCALLIQNGCEAALKVLPADMEAQAKAELNKKAHSVVILCLGNKVLREVTGETTAAGVWSKLETLYMTKLLANKLYLKKNLYTFYMSAGRKISEHIDEFNKIVLYLANIKIKFKDEDLALLLLTSLTASYEHFVDTLLYDHLKRNCPKNNRKKPSGYVNKDDQPSSSGSIYDGSEVMMVMSVEALLDWIMDSGGSYHMTPRLDLFSDFLECDGGRVLLGVNRECKIKGIGKGTLKKEGYTVKLQSAKVKVSLMLVFKKKTVLHRFGIKDWDILVRRDYRCWKRRHTTQGEIDYVHLDLRGPSQVESLGGKRYFLSIVDDYSRRVWVYILKFKHEAFEKFKEWKQLVENQTGMTVKKLRTDNGLEFYNREFKQLCIESGITRHLTVTGMPQQNGLAERMNRTLKDKVRCLLIQSGFPKTFWAEATCTAAYLINRSPSTTIEKKTPMEMWSGHPSDYGMLRTFDCVAYSHVQQGKLKPRAVKCVLLGYPEGVKGYRLYRLDNESPKIVTSRNVVFIESVMYKDTLKDSGVGADKSVEELQVEIELRSRNRSATGSHRLSVAEEEDTHEPLTYQEAVAYEDNHQTEQKLVTYKWLLKIKEGIEGVQKPRYKVRLVARGFTQRASIDYNKVFSPVVRHTSIQVILALTACKDFKLEQLDVKTAFLHGNLEEVVYMRQPLGYEQGNKVCLLKKSLYGLKQSPRQWYKRFDEYILSNGFKRSSYDICVYYRSYAPGEYIYLLLYVDDMLIACKSKAEIGSTKSLLKKEFDMKYLREAKKILGMEILRDRSHKILRVSQSGYVSKILNNFRIDNGKSVQMSLGGHFKLSLKDCPVKDCDVERMSKVPYANAVGSLMYLMVCTRPDIAYDVSIVSRYLANPGKSHWEAVKWILKYLRGTANVGLIYGTNHDNHMDVTCFVNSDYAKDPDKGRSITGYAKYVTLTKAVKEAIWLKGLLEELGVELNRVTVNCDNQGAIYLSRNHVFHEMTKHINVRYYFIREVLEAKTVEVLKVGTEHNAADALMKVVPGHKLKHCLEFLSVGIG